MEFLNFCHKLWFRPEPLAILMASQMSKFPMQIRLTVLRVNHWAVAVVKLADWANNLEIHGEQGIVLSGSKLRP